MPAAHDPKAADSSRQLRQVRRLLARAFRQPEPAVVHRLRTSIRRTEALLREREISGGGKLCKHLARVRRRAGRVRGLDVQMDLLRSFHIGSDDARRQHLLEVMQSERVRQAGKLRKLLPAKERRELNLRLRAAERELAAAGTAPSAAAVAATVLRRFRRLSATYQAFTPTRLHTFRTAAKRLRYLAETALPSPAAARLEGELKQVQDAIGVWHDWSELTALAEREFGLDGAGTLQPALRRLTEARLGEALRATLNARERLLFEADAAPSAKPAASVGAARARAASA